MCVTQQGLKEFRGREWKCSASNGNEEASEGQRKTRSEGQRAVCMRRHRGSQGWKRGGMRTEEGVREKSAKSAHLPPPPPQVGGKFSLQKTFDFYDTVTQHHFEARY